MSLEIIIIKGLPGSGKSTWAKSLVSKYTEKYRRINKDDLRRMVAGDHFSKKNEKLIISFRNSLIEQCLIEGYSVIVDDTNLNPKHTIDIEDLAKKISKDINKDINVVNFSFLHVPLETCIKNDLKREHSVGKDVIMQMYNMYCKNLNKEEMKELIKQDASLEHCVLVDIDGTVAEKGDRSPFDWSKVGEDSPKQPIIDLVKLLSKDKKIIFFSGRDGCCEAETKVWIDKYIGLSEYQLFMRKPKDMRKDSIVKLEMFDKFIRDQYFVEFVLDDRDQVVDMWRKELGLTCLQVNYGNF